MFCDHVFMPCPADALWVTCIISTGSESPGHELYFSHVSSPVYTSIVIFRWLQTLRVHHVSELLMVMDLCTAFSSNSTLLFNQKHVVSALCLGLEGPDSSVLIDSLSTHKALFLATAGS